MKLIKDTTVKEYLKRVIFGADQKIDGWVDDMPAAEESAALQADLDFYKRRVCELCGVCLDGGNPDNCEIAGHGEWVYNEGDNIPYCSICGMPQDTETTYCHSCGTKMGGA